MGRIEKALERMKSQKLGQPMAAPDPQPPSVRRGPEKTGKSSKVDTSTIAQVLLDHGWLLENRVITEGTEPSVRTAYKMLRTRLLQRMRANGWQSLAVTSATPGDGKTLTAINLAISLAGDVNHNVCLVDLDLRHSSIARYLGMELDKGTSDCLRRALSLEECLVRPNIERLMVLPNAQIEAQSSELLSSPRMHEIAQRLVLDDPGRIVVYDMPPILSADDMLAFAPFTDAVLFVVSERNTRRTDVLKARELLENLNLIGTVLNRSDERTASYY